MKKPADFTPAGLNIIMFHFQLNFEKKSLAFSPKIKIDNPIKQNTAPNIPKNIPNISSRFVKSS